MDNVLRTNYTFKLHGYLDSIASGIDLANYRIAYSIFFEEIHPPVGG